VVLIIILIATIIAIVSAPLGLEWIVKVDRNWVLLGNVGQAYGGISALVSAIALIGIVCSLLIQGRQHALDRITSIRGRQAQIYAIVREDPGLYWPVLGGDFRSNSYSSVRRQTFRVEVFQHFAAGYETGLISEDSIRNEVFPHLFYSEENRQFWERGDWPRSGTTRKSIKFARIGNEELARAKVTGPGMALPYPPDRSRELRFDRGSRWYLRAFGAATGIGLAFLISRLATTSKGRVLDKPTPTARSDQ
jgi:hypothetical protein